MAKRYRGQLLKVGLSRNKNFWNAKTLRQTYDRIKSGMPIVLGTEIRQVNGFREFHSEDNRIGRIVDKKLENDIIYVTFEVDEKFTANIERLSKDLYLSIGGKCHEHIPHPNDVSEPTDFEPNHACLTLRPSVSVNRIEAVEETSGLICPSCQGKLIPTRFYKDTQILVCEKCGSFWSHEVKEGD